eukprot:30202-Pelagococcus_subviridis.AAC.8
MRTEDAARGGGTHRSRAGHPRGRGRRRGHADARGGGNVWRRGRRGRDVLGAPSEGTTRRLEVL